MREVTQKPAFSRGVRWDCVKVVTVIPPVVLEHRFPPLRCHIIPLGTVESVPTR